MKRQILVATVILAASLSVAGCSTLVASLAPITAASTAPDTTAFTDVSIAPLTQDGVSSGLSATFTRVISYTAPASGSFEGTFTATAQADGVKISVTPDQSQDFTINAGAQGKLTFTYKVDVPDTAKQVVFTSLITKKGSTQTYAEKTYTYAAH